MVQHSDAESDRHSDERKSRVTRRSILKTAGVTGVTGLAGCIGNAGNGGSSGSTIDELYLGIQVPMSGPYGAAGESIAKAMKLAASDAVKDGQFEKIKTPVLNTQTDPSIARKKAQQHINNGADLLSGNISSASALAIGELALRNDMVYDCVAGSNAVTGERCMPSTFAWSDSAVMQLGGSLGYVLDNNIPTGKDMFMISADYTWGQSLAAWAKNHIAKEYGLNVIGSKFTPFGASDYSSVLTAARNANPDILLMNMSGGDQVTSLPQIKAFGLLDDTTVVYAATNMGDAMALANGLMAHENYYSSIAWYWNYHYSDASANLMERFREKWPNALRSSYVGSFYAGVRASLNAIEQTGSTSLSDIRREIEGQQIDPQIWGVGEKMRACDHRATIATAAVTGKPSSKVSGQDQYKVLEVPDRETILQRMRTCEQTGCNL